MKLKNNYPLFQDIKKEILADSYLSARINISGIENLLVGCYVIDELHNIDSMDYMPTISLAFLTDDVTDFFLFRLEDNIEIFEDKLLEKVKLENLPSNTPKRVLWIEYGATIALYLELEFEIPNEYKSVLLRVLKSIIELHSTQEEFTGSLMAIMKTYGKYFKEIGI